MTSLHKAKMTTFPGINFKLIIAKLRTDPEINIDIFCFNQVLQLHFPFRCYNAKILQSLRLNTEHVYILHMNDYLWIGFYVTLHR